MKMNNLNVLLYYIIYVYNQKYNLIIIYIYINLIKRRMLKVADKYRIYVVTRQTNIIAL